MSQGFSFVAEGTLPATFVLAQTPPPLSADLLQSVTTGQSELRERVTYPTSANMMTIEYFSSPTGTALPFPATPIAAPGTVFARINVMVQNVVFTDGANPTILLSGTVANSPVGISVFGDVVGRAAAVSLGVMPPLTIPGMTETTTGGATGGSTTTPGGTGGTTTSPSGANSNMLSVMIAGSFVSASPAVVSTLSFAGTTGGTGGTPGGTGQAPVVVIAPVSPSVFQKQLTLDASASTNPGGGPLTFAWTSIGNLAAISNGNTATPAVSLNAGPRDYTFQVTVTNAQGFSSVGTITVHYVGL